MASRSYYDLLNVAPTASHEDVKRAFRQQIARYHPDKVQHLGKEFQDMAAERAAELTEAYRILSDDGRRAEYDRVLGAPSQAVGPETTRTPATPAADPPKPESAAASAEGRARPDTASKDGSFTQERATRDEFVRRATIGRFRQALAAVGGEYDDSQARGFDFACVPKAKLFARNKGPRLLGRFVSRVDGAAVADAWVQAGKWGAPTNEEICVFLMGISMAPPKELADAIAEQRRKTRGKVTLIPVDARDWNAHVPTDAPVMAKNVLARLRSGT